MAQHRHCALSLVLIKTNEKGNCKLIKQSKANKPETETKQFVRDKKIDHIKPKNNINFILPIIYSLAHD